LGHLTQISQRPASFCVLQQVFGIEHHTLTLVGEIGNAESCDCCLSIIAGCLVQFVRSQHQMTHIPEGGFIVGNRPAEGAERSHQDFNAIEIGTHMAEYAMQLALDSIYGRLRSHYRFLSWPMPARLPHVRVKTLGERSFLFSKTSRCLD
jgi:hypothetical protein